MPTYIYVCTDCDARFERFQKISEKPVKKCPDCGSKVERLITGGGGVLFKGDGFYITDYRSSQYKEEARKEASSESSNKKGTESSGSEKGEKSD